MLRWQTAGESHGEALVAMIEGLPAGIHVTTEDIVGALARRRLGYGRGARMKFEQDKVRMLTGVRFGETIGSPVAIEIANTEWPKWTEVMSADPLDHDIPREGRNAPLSRPRPGHADLTGMRKYGFDDARPVLERSSARETASRVALGEVAKQFLEQTLGIRTVSHVLSIGGAGITDPQNLEEQAISLVGTDIYEKLIKGYTGKQWGRPCTELPAFIIKRLPVRFTYDNNYFNALYQGIPNGGYTAMVEKMLDGVEVRLGVDYLAEKAELDKLADRVVYTGPVDAYFSYKLGALQYRSVRFETETLDTDNYQGNAVVNYTDAETPYTRIIEHKHFEFGTQPKTVISREYSAEWKPGDEPYYPVNDEKNGALYAEYKKLADAEPGVIFGGRLGEYKYYDMDKVIEAALDVVGRELA